MRRLPIPLSMLLVACGGGSDPDNQNAAAAVDGVTIKAQWGAGRDRLCLQNNRAGLITFATAGDNNCMVKGATVTTDGGFQLKPDGDESCTIDIRMDGGAVVLGQASPACAYYCGPNASYAGKRMEPTSASPATDVAGDPLC